jgi:cardiolipin synthase A/B
MSRLSPLSRDLTPLRAAADQVFSRASGAPLVGGNHVRVLRDAAENYAAWERALHGAERSIHVEMYIIHRDRTGRRFVDLLAAKAREGVAVRVLYDWFGCGLGPVLGLFRPLVTAGGEVRVFNPPRFSTALGWVRRNHRKLISVDGRVAFVGGLCVGTMWEGRPEKRQEPWRDTGVEIVGPATAHADRAFAESWRLSGGTLDESVLPSEEHLPPAGSVNLRLIPTEPFTGAMLRVDLLVSCLARRSLWIADAYFLGHGPYVEALRRAALDGVDVRLLLPQGSDVAWTVPMSRTLYRTLLESGVRIFEWNGTMMHAKTAVADGRWARIGSTNLNLNSWIGNWELDVAIEDVPTARTLESHYTQDLAGATEIVLGRRPKRRRAPAAPGIRARRSARRALHTVTGLGHSIGAAVSGSRPLEPWEYGPLLLIGGGVGVGGVIVFWWPRLLAWPLAALATWVGMSFIVESIRLWRRRNLP